MSASALRHTLPVRVYYEDTDAAGMIYYANYLRFCERARTEWLRHLGFQQEALRADPGLVFVVRSVQADYLKPGVLDDLLDIVSEIERVGPASIHFLQRIERVGLPLFTARVQIACVNLAQRKSAPMPAELRARFAQLIRVPT